MASFRFWPGDEQAVERVAVVQVQAFELEQVVEPDGQEFEAVFGHFYLVSCE
jgi:hypothetical protein